MYDNILYIVARIDSNIYLINTESEEKYALSGVNNYFVEPGSDIEGMLLEVEDGVIKISEPGNGQLLYTFNQTSKTLTKN